MLMYTTVCIPPVVRGKLFDVCTCMLLQAKHASEGSVTWGVDGVKGTITDMKELGVWEPLSVKLQTYKTAIEV